MRLGKYRDDLATCGVKALTELWPSPTMHTVADIVAPGRFAALIREDLIRQDLIWEDLTNFDKAQSARPDPVHPCAGNPGARLMHEWHPISTAPFDRDLELSVIENGEVHALIFPCRRTRSWWQHASTGKIVVVDPTHWRSWPESDGVQ